MEKYFCNYNQSLALKKLGFNEICFATFDSDKWFDIQDFGQNYDTFPSHIIAAPLKSQVFDWFREKYNLYHVITIADLGKYETGNPDFQCAIYSKDPVVITNMDKYKTYEEAESACIDKLIELLQHDK